MIAAASLHCSATDTHTAAAADVQVEYVRNAIRDFLADPRTDRVADAILEAAVMAPRSQRAAVQIPTTAASRHAIDAPPVTSPTRSRGDGGGTANGAPPSGAVKLSGDLQGCMAMIMHSYGVCH